MRKEDGVFVVDTIANVGKYADYGAHFAKAVAFLRRGDLSRLPNGRYDIDGENAWAMVQEATLKAWGAGRPELHREYFDIQLPLTGEETIGVGRFQSASAGGDFDAEKDIGFYDAVPIEPLTLRPGEFAILHPNTCAHIPCCSMEDAGMIIRKVVIKVRK